MQAAPEGAQRDRRQRASRTRCSRRSTSSRTWQDQAPGDITDEWQQVIGRLEACSGALDDADVDPATYDRDKPPAGLTDEQKAAIDAAAKAGRPPETLRALKDLDQQARDVCKTPLTL